MAYAQTIPGTQTVVRALALLKAFTDDQPEMGLTELARSVGLNKTTAFRLLSALEHEGLVTHDTPGGAYRLGPEAIALGARALRATDLRAAARPELDALARETGESADLEILDGADVLVVEEVHGRFVLGTMLSVGSRWPAHATSTGKAMLAHLPEAEIHEVLGHTRRLQATTRKTLTDREALRAELAAIRARGYATADEELEDNYAAVGVPVFNHDGRVAGAISIGGPLTRLTPERVPELAALLRVAAGRISRRLGYKNP